MDRCLLSSHQTRTEVSGVKVVLRMQTLLLFMADCLYSNYEEEVQEEDSRQLKSLQRHQDCFLSPLSAIEDTLQPFSLAEKNSE